MTFKITSVFLFCISLALMTQPVKANPNCPFDVNCTWVQATPSQPSLMCPDGYYMRSFSYEGATVLQNMVQDNHIGPEIYRIQCCGPCNPHGVCVNVEGFQDNATGNRVTCPGSSRMVGLLYESPFTDAPDTFGGPEFYAIRCCYGGNP